jgi:hypothetical protein
MITRRGWFNHKLKAGPPPYLGAGPRPPINFLDYEIIYDFSTG